MADPFAEMFAADRQPRTDPYTEMLKLSEEDPRIKAIMEMRGTDQMHKGDPSPRDILAGRMMNMLFKGLHDPVSTPDLSGFTPNYEPGKPIPSIQRSTEQFKRYVGDAPRGDEELDAVWGGDDNENNTYILKTPNKDNPPQTTEEELELIQRLMDRDLGL
jgi:hypothetical protein